MIRCLCAFFSLSLAAVALSGPVTLTILHTNDLHGHVEATKIKGGLYGGYSRQAYLIDKFRRKDKNVLLLNGGDTFQGTLYFKTYTGLADGFFMNYMGYQAMALGNHEFDLGVAPLGDFIHNLRFPTLACNLDVAAEPALKDVKPYTVIEIDHEKIGLIGAITPELFDISNPGPTVKLLPVEDSIRKAADELKSQGIDKIILISHMGYDLERQLAAKIVGIDIIVGGHSHTLLGSNFPADFPKPAGPYPTIIDNPDGGKTLLLSAWEWGKVLGRAVISFDASGHVSDWKDAAPVVVEQSVPEDLLVASAVAAFQKPIESFKKKIVAVSKTGFSRSGASNRETQLGDLIADAMLARGAENGAVLALMNPGGLRADLEAGPISMEKVMEVQPFGNTMFILELTGEELKETFEIATAGKMLQVSHGVRVEFDLSKPAGQRVQKISLGGTAIEPKKTYRIVTNNFLAGGGDGFLPLKNAKGERLDTKAIDAEALAAYLAAHPDAPELEGRIVTTERQCALFPSIFAFFPMHAR